MADSLFISEVLCFFVNKFGKLTKLQMKSMLVGFYSEDELVEAKDRLFADACNLGVADMPRNRTRSKSDNRAKLITDDLLELYSFLDEAGVLGKLPVYVARNLDRIPTVKMEDMDLFCVSKKMEEMERRLASVESLNVESLIAKLDDMSMRLNTQQVSAEIVAECMSSKLDAVSAQLEKDLSGHSKLDVVPNHETGHVETVDGDKAEGAAAANYADTPSWSGVAAEGIGDPQTKFTLVSRQRQQKPPQKLPVRVHGVKACSEATAIKSIPRRQILAAYVGRLHSDTTEEALTRFLQGEGMKGIVCKKLKAKDGRVFKTAAFYVTCSMDSADLFYDEKCWPSGVELRDWIYK